MRLIGFAMLGMALFSHSAALAQASAKLYSDQDRRLAGMLGVAIARIDICETYRIPGERIAAALQTAGLEISDFTEETEFRLAVIEAGRMYKTIVEANREIGATEAQIVDSACSNMDADYGPDGLLIKNLVQWPDADQEPVAILVYMKAWDQWLDFDVQKVPDLPTDLHGVDPGLEAYCSRKWTGVLVKSGSSYYGINGEARSRSLLVRLADGKEIPVYDAYAGESPLKAGFDATRIIGIASDHCR